MSFVLALTAGATAQTLTVTTVEDAVDFAAPQTVLQLPGPDGKVSFREALTAANNTPGPQTVTFAIPKSEWWLLTDVALLKQEHGIFPVQDDATTIDFTTQTAFTGDTNPDGSEVGIFGLSPNELGVASIYVFGDDCLIKGLGNVLQRGYAVEVWGSGNRIVGCTIDGPLFAAIYLTGPFGGAPSVGNVVGGTAPGEGNVLSSGNDGVRIDAPSNDNVVIGNVLSGSFHGVNVRGSQFTTTANGNRIGGPTPAEANLIAGFGHYGEEGFPVGSGISVQWATDTIIEGNLIGTTPDGLASAGQIGPTGIELGTEASGTIIRDNLISGMVVEGVDHFAGQIFGEGILLEGVASGTIIEGNRIGTDATGQAPLPNFRGVAESFFPGGSIATDTRLGGTGLGQPNHIAFNLQQGVLLTSSITGVRVSGNSIHSNGQLGIDLAPIGPTPNDPLDPDAGPNGRQNFPVLLSAATDATSTTVSGTLDSLPSQQFSLEFFASEVGDPSGFGEGQAFLGSAVVVTNAAGDAAFSEVLPVASPPGWVVTSTATHLSDGSTSEFSASVPLGPWEVFGPGKVGSFGVPQLVGMGPLTAGSNGSIDLTQAPPASVVVLVVGLSPLLAPFKGGTFVPDADVLIVLTTDATGSVSLPFTWPGGVPAGTSFYLQAWIQDSGATFGLSASNGLHAVVP
ncbi:MAG TPA: hypothetical protein VFY71_04045 [Planctomycetota bacterium]|nr:hypothetical protein [Planctomycetota bacterium]